MRHILKLALVCIVSVAACAADLERLESVSTGPAGQSTKIEWKREGRTILTEHIPETSGTSLCMFTIGESGTDLTIWIRNKRIVSLSTAIPGYLISLDDFTKSGEPDFLQIKDPSSGRLIEAFSIVDGLIEPLPKERFKKDREEFYFDDDIVDYLKQKPNQ